MFGSVYVCWFAKRHKSSYSYNSKEGKVLVSTNVTFFKESYIKDFQLSKQGYARGNIQQPCCFGGSLMWKKFQSMKKDQLYNKLLESFVIVGGLFVNQIGFMS